MSQMPLLATLMEPEELVKRAVLVKPLTELHALPVTLFQPVALVVQSSVLLVLVAVAASAEGARRRERRRAERAKPES